jgi:NADH:ubiquinone oxidoreductase subunit 6 (subunit J)
MNSLLKKIKEWIVTYQADIILFIGVILISLLSFAIGFIVAKQQEKEPLRIEQNIRELGHELYTNYMRIDYSYIRKDS